jgi:hypothetical protein
VNHAYTAKGFLKSSPESHQRLHLLLGQIDIGDDIEEFDKSKSASFLAGGAMKSGPIGSCMVSDGMASTACLKSGSTDQSNMSRMGFVYSGRRAPQIAISTSWSRIQRMAVGNNSSPYRRRDSPVK